MTFHLIAFFSGLASQAEAASTAAPALRRLQEAEALSVRENDEKNAVLASEKELVSPQQADSDSRSPNLRALWGTHAGPKECVKVHTDKAGSLFLKIVRRINGSEQGTPVKCTQQDEVYCDNGHIVRVDVWSGSQDQLWQGTFFTNKNDGSYQQMTPTQKWSPHWMAGGHCNNSSPIAVTGKYNNTCQVCTCQRTGSGRICSLIPQGAPANWCIVPNKGNFVAPSWGPKPAAFVASQPAPAPTPAPTPAPAVNSCPKDKPNGQQCKDNCDCIKMCSTKWFFLLPPSYLCC